MNATFEHKSTLSDLATLALEQSASLKRTASAYVATMVDVVTQLNNQPINKLEGVDLNEIRNQTGNLVYFSFKTVGEPIPIDIEFVPRLYCHLRRPCLLLLKKEKQWLSSAHRRIYSKLEKEHLLEKHFNPDTDMFLLKFENMLKEIDRYKNMLNLVVGGGRKLDILNHAQNVFSQAKFELYFRERSLLDPHHPRHSSIQRWLKNSQHQGSVDSFKADLKDLENRLLASSQWIFDMQESISGVVMPLDNDHPDLSKTWYNLGQVTGRGDSFTNNLIKNLDIEEKVKRSTFVHVRKLYDAHGWGRQLESIDIEDTTAQAKAEKLSKFIMDVATLIDGALHHDSEAYQAVQSDLQHQVLTEKEGGEARQWISANQIRLHHVMMDAYQHLIQHSEQHSNLVIAKDVEEKILLLKNIDTQLVSEFEPVDWETEVQTKLDPWLKTDQNQESFWSEGLRLHNQLTEHIAQVAFSNVSFHKELRATFTDAQAYEAKVMSLIEQTQQWRTSQSAIEDKLIQAYKEGPITNVSEIILQKILDFILERQIMEAKKAKYDLLQAEPLEERSRKATDQVPNEALARMDYLFQEIQSIPKATYLTQALQDWQKTLSATDLAAKREFLESNEERLGQLLSQISNEMRELLNQVPQASRRLRFQVFGLSDFYAASLDRTRSLLMNILGRSTNIDEFKCLFQNLKDVETQVIEAQKATKKGGTSHNRLKEMVRMGQINLELLAQLEADLKENYRDLDVLLGKIAKDLKQVADWRLRLGDETQFDYLNITVNADDLDQLNQQYQFAESAQLEQIRRFCLAYQYKSNLTAEVFMRARKGDPSLPTDVINDLDKKTLAAFFEDRTISALTKLNLFIHMPEIFEAEVQLLLHTLNLVQPNSIRDKAIYRGMVQSLSVFQNRPPGLKRMSTVLFGRLQSRLIGYKPDGLKSNFEHNRSSLFTDIQDASGGEFKKPV
ncbi:MAG: hypothetical protein KDC71_05095 [Acidobacteria bacterium]|nr:hypothetical protein [Acidobacteriota bacterium]